MNKNDRQRFEEMYSEFYLMLKRNACFHHIPADYVDDVVQDTFLSYVCREYSMNLPTGNMKLLLSAILKNRCADFHRGRRHYNCVELEERLVPKEIAGKASCPSDLIISKEHCQAILREIDHMPEKLRQVAVLKLIEGRSTEEVCRILNITEKTCYSRVSRIRSRLKKKLEEEM